MGNRDRDITQPYNTIKNNNTNKKEINLENYLKKFVHYNLSIDNLNN